jgi:hypothetical protein
MATVLGFSIDDAVLSAPRAPRMHRPAIPWTIGPMRIVSSPSAYSSASPLRFLATNSVFWLVFLGPTKLLMDCDAIFI